MIVGGGLGIPPLLELAKRLHGNTVALLGYREDPFMEEEFQRLGLEVHICKPIRKLRFSRDRVGFAGESHSSGGTDICLWTSPDAAICFDVGKRA